MNIEIENLKINLLEHENVWMPTRFGIALGEILVKNYKANIEGKNVLELGVGSGVISILCGLLGAKKVTALDINNFALELSIRNWALNGIVNASFEPKFSDLFIHLEPTYQGSYSIIVSNPPTFPGEAVHKNDRNSWEMSGDDGRVVLDAMLQKSKDWLTDDGVMVVIATSKQGHKKTTQLLNENWKSWKVIHKEDIPLASFYYPFVDLWLAKGKAEGEERIFKKGNDWFQTLYFIEARK